MRLAPSHHTLPNLRRILLLLLTLLLVLVGPQPVAFADTPQADAETSQAGTEDPTAVAAVAATQGDSDQETPLGDDDQDPAELEAAAAPASGGSGDPDGVVIITSSEDLSDEEENSSSQEENSSDMSAAQNDGGANQDGPYTSDPEAPQEPSRNGNDNDNSNKPCAGCVGNADDKNPPGQFPNADGDGNSGYECDSNQGVGKSNPAHTGCVAVTPASDDVDIDLVKSASPTSTTVGATVDYRFVITNTGDVDLVDVVLDDDKLGWTDEPVADLLAVGDSVTVTEQYVVREQHVIGSGSNRRVINTATVTGTSADDPGRDVHATDSATVTVTVPPLAPDDVDIDLVKRASPTSTTVGATVDYRFVITNTGDVDLVDVVLDDDKLGWTDEPVADLLAVGDSVTVTEQYVVREQHVIGSGSNRRVINTATVTGTSADDPGQDVHATDAAVVTVTTPPAGPAPDISLIKSGPRNAQVGDVITYTFTVRNEGNTTLSDVHIRDPLLGGDRIPVSPSTLAPRGQAGSSGTATATYVVDEDDSEVINGVDTIHNEATVRGEDPSGKPVFDDDDHDVELPVTPPGPDPEIDLDKDGPRRAQVGDTVVYTFTVRNEGNTTLSDVHIRDPLLGGDRIPVSPSTLAPRGQAGSSGTATATYIVDEDNIEVINGVDTIHNEATVRGEDPSGNPVFDDDDHDISVETPLVGEGARPSLLLDKSGPESARVGDRITYRFRVTNTGDTTLTDVHVTDPLLGGRIAVRPSTLRPGETGTATARYTVTDADAGTTIVNTAVAIGTTPTGETVEDDDEHRTPVPLVPPGPGPGPEPGPRPGPDPEPAPELPATGTDAPTQLLAATLALMLGMLLLRTGDRLTPAPSTPDGNGFVRRRTRTVESSGVTRGGGRHGRTTSLATASPRTPAARNLLPVRGRWGRRPQVDTWSIDGSSLRRH